jgi:hypothetical protein
MTMRTFGPLLRAAVAAALLAVAACAPRYTLVPAAAPVRVAQGSMTVTPGVAWNRCPKDRRALAGEEEWTQNGRLLDLMTFIGGVPEGRTLVRQGRKVDRKVPTFRADMSPQDLVSMVESLYRIRAGAGVFAAEQVAPATFLGRPGLRFDYGYVGGDGVRRRGRTMIAVIDRKLYLAALDGAQSHYFDAALPAFVAVTESARLS